MKVVQKNSLPDETMQEVGTLAAAREEEKSGNNARAIELYEKARKEFPSQANIYDRLMILYRKEKMWKKELAIVNAAIAKFTALFQTSRLHPSKKIASLSKSILLSVGLSDKKGKSLYLPQPLAKWEKRKKTVQHKIGAKS